MEYELSSLLICSDFDEDKILVIVFSHLSSGFDAKKLTIGFINPLKGLIYHYNIKEWEFGSILLNYIYGKIEN